MGIAEALVIVGALALAGFLGWFFFGPRKARRAEVSGDTQEVTVTVRGGYSPDLIRVQEGVPLRLHFDRQESGDCTSRVVFPDFAVSKTLPAFTTTTLEFTPDRTGEFGFACGMNMVHGTLVVESATEPAFTDRRESEHQVAQAVGVGPTTHRTIDTEQAEFRVAGMSCASCVVNIESVLSEVAGVDRVDVSFGTERATVEYDPTRVSADQLQAVVADAGYRLMPRPAPGTADTEDHEAAERQAEISDLTRRVALGAVLSAPVVFAVMAVDLFDASWVPDFLLNHWVQLALIAPVMVMSGWPIHRTGRCLNKKACNQQ